MPSPFPGMNPYLEQDDAWHDFHERFMPLAAELIIDQLGSDYIVKIDEHVYIHELGETQRQLLGRADVAIGTKTAVDSGRSSAVVATGAAPANVRLPAVDVESLSVVEIRDRRTRNLITVIELLSPSNKDPGPDREQYISKRQQLLASKAHFVEIDLLRGGLRMPMDELPVCDYCIMISRVEHRPQAGVWPVQLREPLPEIPIPLRSPDKEPRLDLQQMIHRIYDGARYERFIYEGEPFPSLSENDASWAQSIVPVNQS